VSGSRSCTCRAHVQVLDVDDDYDACQFLNDDADWGEPLEAPLQPPPIDQPPPSQPHVKEVQEDEVYREEPMNLSLLS
jgi:hypothetical protein